MENLSDVIGDRRHYLVYLPAGTIRFDRENYQRPPVPATIKKIRDRWNWMGLGIIPVSQRDSGEFYGIDGQQRTLGTIERHGADFKMQCEAYVGLSIAEEAQMFRFINIDRRHVPIGVQFNSGHKAEDPEVLFIVEILDQMQIKHSWNPSDANSQDRMVVCWSALRDVLRAGGGAGHLERVLQMIDDTWGCPHASMEALFIKGVDLLLRKHNDDPNFSVEEAVRCLSKVPATSICLQGKEIRDLVRIGKKPSAPQGIYRALHDNYNRNKRNRLRPYTND